MLCPNCSEHLETLELSHQKVLHCNNCGGSFFEENGINRITEQDAKTLTQGAQNNIVMGTPKICPKDNIFLHSINNDEAIPSYVSLLKCPKCNGVFAYSDDLIKFKKAQNAKLEFFKVWQNPLPALKSVLVLSFLAVLSLTVFSNLNSRSLQITKADSFIGTVSFTHSGRYLFVNFSTATPFTSSILITDKTTNSSHVTPISPKLSKLHYATITADTAHTLYYQIILEDGRGKEIKTDEKKLQFTP
jgi:Zn-finger nucleic acid-binding protein